MTTSPGGDEGSGLGSFGVGVHLLAIPVFELSSDKRIVAKRDILFESAQPFQESETIYAIVPVLIVNRHAEQGGTQCESQK